MEKDVYLVVKSIDLLTKTEARKLPKNIRARNWWWWLQSPGYDYFHAAAVLSTGVIDDSGFMIDYSNGVVRPALLVDGLDSLNLPLYTEIEIFGLEWIYIGKNKALAETYIFDAKFSPTSNDYKKSDIKQKLDDWLEEKKAEFDED